MRHGTRFSYVRTRAVRLNLSAQRRSNIKHKRKTKFNRYMKTIHIYLAAAALLALGACTTSQNATRVSGAAGTASTTDKTSTPQAGKTHKNPTAAKPAKPSKNQAAAVTGEQLAGEWTIVDVNGTAVGEREEMPYLNFDNGRLYGNNGCNILNGSYTLAGSTITFSKVASTMRFCPDADFEHAINVAIGDGTPRTVAIEKIGHESYLYLMESNGHKLLTARRHNMGFLNGQWQVTSIDGQAIDDEECNIFFDIAEGKVHGNTGCNYFNGDIYISPERTNAIKLSNMGVTRMACPKTAQETAMLVALEQTASAIQGGTDTAMLLDESGAQLMTLKRSTQQNSQE